MDEANGDMAGYFLEVLTLATAEAALAGRPGCAGRIVAEALQRHPLDSLPPGARPYVRLGIFYAGLGDLERAAEMQAALERHGLNRGRFAEAEWHRLRGSILLARRRYLEAQAQLRLAADQEECVLCSLPALGRSYELAGRDASHRARPAVPAAPTPYAHDELARSTAAEVITRPSNARFLMTASV